MPGTASEAGVDAVAAIALCMGFGVHGYEMDEMSRLGEGFFSRRVGKAS